jgi:hypothetical protein
MNPSDTTTTTAVLTAVRQAVDAAAPSGGPDAGLPRVMAAARFRRGRRRVLGGGLAGGALAAGAALTVALTGTAAGPAAVAGGAAAGPAAGGGRAAAGAAGSNARLAAWSVRAAPDGSVTLTLHQLTDAAGLKQALAAHQVPALLHFGAGACSADRAALRDVPVGIYRFSPSVSGERATLSVITATFNTAMWPAGSELYIAGSPLGPQVSVIPQGHYQGCA